MQIHVYEPEILDMAGVNTLSRIDSTPVLLRDEQGGGPWHDL